MERNVNEMQLKRLTPADVVTHAAGVKMKPLTALVSGNGFNENFSTVHVQAHIICHRCRKLRIKRDSLSASIETELGERVQHYLCATCCSNIAGKEANG